MAKTLLDTIDELLESVADDVDDSEVVYKLRSARQLLQVVQHRCATLDEAISDTVDDEELISNLRDLGYLNQSGTLPPTNRVADSGYIVLTTRAVCSTAAETYYRLRVSTEPYDRNTAVDELYHCATPDCRRDNGYNPYYEKIRSSLVSFILREVRIVR